MSEAAVTERTGIARIRAGATRRAGTVVGIGDDAAVLELGRPALACVDALVDGVHFRRGATAMADLGHKALAVNLSDIAAMGGAPRAALVALVAPADGLDEGDLADMYAGMEALAADHGVTVAGGDTTAGPAMVVSVTVLGEMRAGVAPMLRAGGRPGDLLCVTGPLGAAAAGLMIDAGRVPAAATGDAPALLAALHRPVPRVADGALLAGVGTRAAIDISDGLLIDAGRLAAESRCAARIDLDAVPLATGVRAVAAAAGAPADVLAATGGEDYELLVALPAAAVDAARRALPRGLHPVGELAAGEGVQATRAGVPVAVEGGGWELP